jgi:hypothetical protein
VRARVCIASSHTVPTTVPRGTPRRQVRGRALPTAAQPACMCPSAAACRRRPLPKRRRFPVLVSGDCFGSAAAQCVRSTALTAKRRGSLSAFACPTASEQLHVRRRPRAARLPPHRARASLVRDLSVASALRASDHSRVRARHGCASGRASPALTRRSPRCQQLPPPCAPRGRLPCAQASPALGAPCSSKRRAGTRSRA